MLEKPPLDVEITRAIARAHILYSNRPHVDERVHHMVVEACARAAHTRSRSNPHGRRSRR